MYSKEQKDIALRIYHQTESVTETIRILGYPIRRNLYTWIAEENTPPKTRKEYPVINNPPDHPRNPPLVEGSVSSTDISSDEINQLKAQIQDMQLEIDILKETISQNTI